MKTYLPKPKVCICGCEKYFTPFRMGQKWISKSHQLAWLNNTPEGRAEKEKQRLKRLAKFKQDLAAQSVVKAKPHQKGLNQQLQDLINTLAKIVDYGQPCIVTGQHFTLSNPCNAGHFISVGANETIRYNLHNIHAQSFISNGYNGGDPEGYKLGIVKQYGVEYLRYLYTLKATQVLKLSGDELIDKIACAKRIIKQLPERKVYNAQSRILLRDVLNTRLGIYKNGVYKNYTRETEDDNKIVK